MRKIIFGIIATALFISCETAPPTAENNTWLADSYDALAKNTKYYQDKQAKVCYSILYSNPQTRTCVPCTPEVNKLLVNP